MEQVVISILVAVFVSLTTYAGKVQNGEEFDWYKIIRTGVIGLALGGYAAYSGYQITGENWEGYLAANAGFVAVLDQILKAVYRKVTA